MYSVSHNPSPILTVKAYVQKCLSTLYMNRTVVYQCPKLLPYQLLEIVCAAPSRQVRRMERTLPLGRRAEIRRGSSPGTTFVISIIYLTYFSA